MAQGNYSTSAFLKIAFNTARGKEGEGTIRPEIAGEDETVGCSLRSRLSPPRVKKGLRASPLSLSLFISAFPFYLEDGRTKRMGVERIGESRNRAWSGRREE